MFIVSGIPNYLYCLFYCSSMCVSKPYLFSHVSCTRYGSSQSQKLLGNFLESSGRVRKIPRNVSNICRTFPGHIPDISQSLCVRPTTSEALDRKFACPHPDISTDEQADGLNRTDGQTDGRTDRGTGQDGRTTGHWRERNGTTDMADRNRAPTTDQSGRLAAVNRRAPQPRFVMAQPKHRHVQERSRNFPG